MKIGICHLCSKEFKKTRKSRIFCGKSCAGKVNLGNYDRNKRKNGKNFICKTCRKSYYVPRYRIKKTKYCSRSCLAKIHLASYFPVYGFRKLGNPPRKYKRVTINGKNIREHRWIMQNHLGRKLKTWEHVHHINGNPQDNRIGNLAVLSASEHMRIECAERKKSFKQPASGF